MISDHPTITKHAQFIKELMLSKIKPVEFETYAKNYMTEVCQNIYGTRLALRRTQRDKQPLLSFYNFNKEFIMI
jgi:hypothetical protein